MDQAQPQQVGDRGEGGQRRHPGHGAQAGPVETDPVRDQQEPHHRGRDERPLLAEEEGGGRHRRAHHHPLRHLPFAAQAPHVEEGGGHQQPGEGGVAHEAVGQDVGEGVEQPGGGGHGRPLAAGPERPAQPVEGDRPRGDEDHGRQPQGHVAEPDDRRHRRPPQGLEHEGGDGGVDDAEPVAVDEPFDGAGVGPVVADGDVDPGHEGDGRGVGQDDRRHRPEAGQAGRGTQVDIRRRLTQRSRPPGGRRRDRRAGGPPGGHGGQGQWRRRRRCRRRCRRGASSPPAACGPGCAPGTRG